MAGDTWQASYEAAERLHRAVLTEVRERVTESLEDDVET